MFHNWFVFHDLQSKAEPNETEKNEWKYFFFLYQSIIRFFC